MRRQSTSLQRGVIHRLVQAARVEAMERRTMLAVSPAEYATIRSAYPDFSLPADMASINIMEIAAADLSVATVKAAIATAATTTLPDLVVARTTDAQNTITYAAASDELKIDIPSSKGAITLVGFGPKKLTLNAAGLSRVLSTASLYSSTTQVGLGGIAVVGGKVSDDYGGGIYAGGGTLALANVSISGNQSYSSSFFAFGGGLYASYTTLTMANVVVRGNEAYCSHSSYTAEGGGIWLQGSAVTLTNVRVSGNTVSSYSSSYNGEGGGIRAESSTLTLTNVVVSGNKVSSSSTSAHGGGIYARDGAMTLTNVTMSGNVASGWGYGGGVYMLNNPLTLDNSIVAGNTAPMGGPDVRYAGTGTLSGSCNLIGVGTGQTSLVQGVDGNLVGTSASPIDPLFVNRAGTDWTQWDLRPQLASPSVDAGSNALVPAGITTDLDGNARIQNGTVDMGAYEYGTAISDPPSEWVISGTAGNDVIALNQVGGTYQLNVNGTPTTKAANLVSSITINGLDGNDVVTVDPSVVAGVTINGGLGADTLTGGAGADLISGGGGADSISGGLGADTLSGNGGFDTISGNGGADNITGGGGADQLYGSAGADTVLGAAGNDVLNGGGGTDSLDGGGGSDTLYGAAGADTILGGTGNDLIYAGGGDDWIYVDDGTTPFADTVVGGDGTDHVDADALDMVQAEVLI